MRGARAFCLLLALFFSAGAAHAQSGAAAGPEAGDSLEALKYRMLKGLKGTDDRRIVDSDDYPWSAVGRVNLRTGGFCTGTVIAPQEVLTAAHCLWNRRTRSWLTPPAINFLAGYRRGDYIAHRKVESYTLADPAITPEAGEGRFRPHDWAVLRLDDPIDRIAGVLPLAPAGLAGGYDNAQIGYSQDKPHILTLDEGCEVETARPGSALLRHWCDAVHGDSGSPILAIGAGGIYVIGIHVATRVHGDERTGLAVPVASVRTALRR